MKAPNIWISTIVAIAFVCATVSCLARDEPTHLGQMQLLDGYEHQALRGFDSKVGKISKKGGLEISYEIGRLPKPGAPRLGGDFSDRPKLVPKKQVRWYREQIVNGHSAHLAHRKDDLLLVSFPQQGINFSVKVQSPEEMADALLMILTYPAPLQIRVL